MTQEKKKYIFWMASFIFFADFISLLFSVINNQDDKNIIDIDDFLLIFGLFFLIWIYISILNLSEKFRTKIFNIASSLVEDKKKMYKNCNLSLLIGTLIFILIFTALFCFSVLPFIYNQIIFGF